MIKALYLTIVILLFINFDLFSQKNKIDSLLKIYNTTRIDTAKIEALLAITDLYSFQNPDSAILLAKRAKLLAKRLHNNKYLANASTELGWAFYVSGNYTSALENFLESLKIYEKSQDWKNISTSLGNIGSVYLNQKDYKKAREYYSKALTIDQKTGNQKWIASDISNLGIIYMTEGNYNKALEFYTKALKINKNINNKRDISMNLGNIGNVYFRLGEDSINNINKCDSLYKIAASYYFEAIKIDEELGRKLGIAIKLGNLGELYSKMKKYNYAEIYLKRAISISDSIGASDILDNWHKNLSELYEKTNNPIKALYHYKTYKTIKDSINSIETTQKSSRLEMKYEFEKIQAAEKAEQDKKDFLVESEKNKQQLILLFVLVGMILVSGFAIFAVRQKNIIKKEKKRSDELLLNILPLETAEELKSTGTAKPKQFDLVTVLFTDFKGFTKIAEKMSADELVNELHLIFSEFDKIISKYPIEKIKTIGDSYMCAGGLPTANTTNPTDVILAALEIQEYMNKHVTISNNNVPQWQIRIGIHSGPVVAGVVGIKKFVYDIWGDTVNTASRMESSGEPGKVNISGSTYELIKSNLASNLTTIYRGEIEAKNKGKIKMYFVEKS
jgi:class 3 adenylate cyclase/Tfp pilus assembly protein PilF